MTPTEQRVINEAVKVIEAQSDVLKKKKGRLIASLPMNVEGLREAVLEMWGDVDNNIEE